MEDQSCDQAEILERVRHLSGETDAINDIFSTNQSVRMNFGVPQGPQVKSPQPSLQSLAAVGRSSNTEGAGSLSLAGMTRPPPGFSDNSQTQQVATKQLLIPTLGVLGSSSLLSSPGLGLTALSPSPASGCQQSLSSLASSHLANTGLQTRLSSLSSQPASLSLTTLSAASKPGGPSLSNLASSHLGQPASQGSTFNIPSIFGEKKVESGSVQPEINLMSALKLNSDLEITNKKAETSSLKVEENIVNINILVPHNNFHNIKSILRKRTKTPFSFALTRKFTRKNNKTNLKIHSLPEHTIEIFKFDSLSPDDLVLKAQKQSRSFTR